MIISYVGLVLGYVNKVVLFIHVFTMEQIGLINLVLSLGMLFSQFSNLGTINAVIKFLPYFKERNIKDSAFFKLSIKVVLVGVVLLTGVTFLLKDQIIYYFSEKSSLFVSNYYWLIPIGIANVFYVLFDSFLRMYHQNIISIFVNDFLLRITITSLLVLVWFDIIDFNQFLVLHCLVYFISPLALLLKIFYDKAIFSEGSLADSQMGASDPRRRISSKFRKIIFNYSLFSYSNTLGILIVTTMDSLMITYFIGLKFTGIYTTMMFLVSAMQVPYRSLTRVSEPLVPKLWKERQFGAIQKLYQQLASISLIIILYMFLIVWLNRVELFSFLPAEFNQGMWVFLFLIIGRIVDSFLALNGLILLTSKKYKYDIIFTVTLIVLVYLFNLLLIPVYGISGAAISTSFAIIVYNVGRMYFVWKWYRLHPFEKNQAYIIALALAILLVVEVIPHFGINRIVYIGLCSVFVTVVFFGVLIRFKLSRDMNQYLNKLVSKVFRKS